MTVTITTHSPAQTQALAERLAKLEVLQTEIEFRFVTYRKQG